MRTPHYTFGIARAIAALSLILLFQCTDESVDPSGMPPAGPMPASGSTVSPSLCDACTYVVPSSTGTAIVDGAALNLKPGSVICLSAANKYVNVLFRNLVGTGAEPIIITNCGGAASVVATGKPYAMKVESSKHFRIKGGTGSTYGIKLIGGHMGLTLEKFSTIFEVNNIEVGNSGFAGIMAKTDPTCDDATIRGNFVMQNLIFHDNYVHDTGGEGLYIGNSFYETGMYREGCGYRLPHTIEGLKIYNNRIERSGWDAIQVGCAISGAHVYRNRIENYGYLNVTYQNNGIQFSQGTRGICYRNLISKGPGIGINVVGFGDAFVHDNVILNAGTFGIFCDERNTRDLPGFTIANNTIINPAQDGIRMYNEYVPGVIYNNIIVNPGSFAKYVYPRTPNDAYVYKINKYIPLTMSNNLLTTDILTVGFKDAANGNYRITESSPARDQGRDVSSLDIMFDYYGLSRLRGTAYDIGATEY
ncbi:MAG TPA: right-handed parallel beta-helix repeat-containing protein [Chryseosolibacter sp.]|nr:right-handed parallel beta-helix repeat-containing protein [Chryseosolibacter sp.]